MRIINALYNRATWLWDGISNLYAQMFLKEPKVLSIEETLDLIINEHYSVSRNGDGELNIMLGRSIPFQKKDERLASILREAHIAVMDQYFSCVPDVFNGYDNLNEKAIIYYNHFLHMNRYNWYRLAKAPLYGNTFVSRFYIDYVDKAHSKHQMSRLKEIWKGQSVILVEGKDSKLGVGNDLFNEAISVKRILGPAEDAFEKYDELMDIAQKNSSKDDLILLALGPTATAMAYELAKIGYWAVDIGHIDIEYEWMLMGAETKVPVLGKYTNESTGDKVIGTLPEDVLNKYKDQIIAKVL